MGNEKSGPTPWDYVWYEEYELRTARPNFAELNEEAKGLVNRLVPLIEDGDELRAVVEADLLLMERLAERNGCGCPRHRAWRV